MATIIKFINNSNRDLKNVLSYVAKDKQLSDGIMGGIADNPEDAYLRMETVKKLWNKTGGRTYIHIVVSPEQGDTESMEQLSKRIIQEFSNFACFYGIHNNTSHCHCHLVLNSVGFNGRKFSQSKKEFEAFKDKVKKIWHDISPEDIEFDLSFDDYEEYEDYDPDYPEDDDTEYRHIYWYGSADGYVDTAHREHIDVDDKALIYRKVDNTDKYYPVLADESNGKVMAIKVNKETDIKPMVLFADKDGYLTLDEPDV